MERRIFELMPRFLVTWLITAIGLVLTAQIIPGIQIENFWIAIIAAVVMGLINAFVRPILVFFTLPLTFLTLGLFLLIVNAISFSLVGYFTPGFQIGGFLDALFGSIILSCIVWIINEIFGNET